MNTNLNTVIYIQQPKSQPTMRLFNASLLSDSNLVTDTQAIDLSHF